MQDLSFDFVVAQMCYNPGSGNTGRTTHFPSDITEIVLCHYDRYSNVGSGGARCKTHSTTNVPLDTLIVELFEIGFSISTSEKCSFFEGYAM